MKLDMDAVICKGGKWFDGQLDGFSFVIKDRIKSRKNVCDIKGHVPLTKWLKDNGIPDNENKLAETFLRSVKIYANDEKYNQKVGMGVDKIFLYTGREAPWDESKHIYNLLCAQCVWTCKQGKNVQIYSCKAFNGKKPI